MKKQKPPAYLQDAGKKFWRKILADIVLEEPHDLERLAQSCHCLDQIAEARTKIEAEGAYFVDRWNQPKEHPAAKSIRDNKILFARLVRELCLDIEQPDESRPPRRY